MRTHHDFIISPITRILEDAVASCRSCGHGIETYPLSEYVMQSTFLKMTGFQEQKLKCILWELATDDYEFRYQQSGKSHGECSHYRDKAGIFNELWGQVRKCNPSLDFTVIKKADIMRELSADMNRIFMLSSIVEWFRNDYAKYQDFISHITDTQLIKARNPNEADLFVKSDSLPPPDKENSLYDAYDKLYRHRNRCAHNLLSYQNHLPTLGMLITPAYKYENYFIRFYVIALIDRIFVCLWKEYLSALESYEW